MTKYEVSRFGDSTNLSEVKAWVSDHILLVYVGEITYPYPRPNPDSGSAYLCQ